MIRNYHFINMLDIIHNDPISCKYFVTFTVIPSDNDHESTTIFKSLREKNYVPFMS